MATFQIFLDTQNWVECSWESVASKDRAQPDFTILFSVALGRLTKVSASKVSYQWKKESNDFSIS